MKSIEGADVIQKELPDILHDESRFESGVPDLVCFPASVEELETALGMARERGLRVTFIGAQTGTTGGAVPESGTCAVVFSGMNRIRSVDWSREDVPVLVCDPGVSLDTIEKFLTSPQSWPYSVPGQERLRAGYWFYPPDPTEMTAQLGGTVATNASGARSYMYGPTRPHIAWLDLVLADGRTIRSERSGKSASKWDRTVVADDGSIIEVPPLPYGSTGIKNASGYFNSPDMEQIDIFIGSEGTLAATAAIGIFLRRAPHILSGLSFFGSVEGAFDFADFLRSEENIAAIEFFDTGSLRFINQYRKRLPEDFPDFPPNAASALLWEYVEKQSGDFEAVMERWESGLLKTGSSFDATWSGFDASEQERLHHFRHALPEMVNSIVAENKRNCPGIRKIGTDSSFPAAAFRTGYAQMMELIEPSGIAFAAFGHLGDHHIHINLIPSDNAGLDKAFDIYDKLMMIALDHKGTISAEHGIGKIKKKYLPAMYGAEGVAAMRAVKRAFDPQGLLNPGNLF